MNADPSSDVTRVLLIWSPLIQDASRAHAQGVASTV